MNILTKGTWIKIKKEFVYDCIPVLEKIKWFQKKYNLEDVDTVINAVRDVTIGNYIKADELNIEKHGLDVKFKNKFVEVKQAVIINKRDKVREPTATFNDTSLEKCEAFRSNNIFIVLAIWESAADLLAMTFGKTKYFAGYLEDRIKNRKQESRSTQSISLYKLLSEYRSELYCGPGFTPDQVIKRLSVLNKKLASATVQQFEKIPDIRKL